MLLAIDTSTRYAGVALADDGLVVAGRTWFSRVNHSAELIPAIAEILKEGRITTKDLTGIAVSLGPGGFSALRVGLSAAKGLAAAEGLELAGIGTLESEAHSYRGCGLPVCAMLDAGRNEAASAVFAADGSPVGEERISPVEELLESISGPTLFCGEGVASRAAIIRERLGKDAVVVNSPTPAGRLWSLALLGRKRLELGQADNAAALQPNYLRMPSIGGARQRDRRTQRSNRGQA